MPVITINGPVGCGAVEIGQMVSQRLDINYVDRMVFAEAAKIVGSPVGALIEKEQKIIRFRDRLANLLRTMLEHEVGGNVDFVGILMSFGTRFPQSPEEDLNAIKLLNGNHGRMLAFNV